MSTSDPKATKRFSLKRETLRELTIGELDAVNGGALDDTVYTPSMGMGCAPQNVSDDGGSDGGSAGVSDGGDFDGGSDGGGFDGGGGEA